MSHNCSRYIMHVDMDAFYASIEQMDNPQFRGKPIIIGSDTSRGVVATCSYEARAFGIRSAMPTYIAKAKCPHAIFVCPKMSRYRQISQQIMESLADITPYIEVASVDEAYLDISGLENIYGTPKEIAQKVKSTIFEASEGLTCSIGVAPIKFLAKIASDENKPNGFYWIEEENMQAFLLKMPIGKIPGVGKKFLEELKKIGVYACKDVLQLPYSFWEKKYGKGGVLLYERAQGIDNREIETQTIRKSESAETTLSENIIDKEILKTYLYKQADRVAISLRKDAIKGRTITLKVKYENFKQVTRQVSFETRINSTDTIFQYASSLLEELTLDIPVRLIGLGVSNFENDLPKQLSLLETCQNSQVLLEEKRENLDLVMDNLRKKYGTYAISRGRLLKK